MSTQALDDSPIISSCHKCGNETPHVLYRGGPYPAIICQQCSEIDLSVGTCPICHKDWFSSTRGKCLWCCEHEKIKNMKTSFPCLCSNCGVDTPHITPHDSSSLPTPICLLCGKPDFSYTTCQVCHNDWYSSTQGICLWCKHQAKVPVILQSHMKEQVLDVDYYKQLGKVGILCDNPNSGTIGYPPNDIECKIKLQILISAISDIIHEIESKNLDVNLKIIKNLIEQL